VSSQAPGRRDEQRGRPESNARAGAGRPSERRKVAGRKVAKRRPSARLAHSAEAASVAKAGGAARGKAGGPGPSAHGEGHEEHVLTATLPNKHGLHMRPAKHLVELANSFPCEITLVAKGLDADAKSILGVIGLGAECGEEIEIRARGPRAKEAAGAVADLLESLAEMQGESKGKKTK